MFNGWFHLSGIISSWACRQVPDKALKAAKADVRMAFICRDKRFKVALLLYVTNISRIILSQSIKSLNLHEYALL